MDRKTIADKIVEIAQKDVDAKLREITGKNRSPRIDEFNKRVGVVLGSPYCASAGWCAIDDACKELGLKNPVKPTGSSQMFRMGNIVPKKYIRTPESTAKKGDSGIYKVDGSDWQGHYTIVAEDQECHPLFKTIEYNTDGSGSRDGDGAYAMDRCTVGKTGNKFFYCFVDVPQYILDYNSVF